MSQVLSSRFPEEDDGISFKGRYVASSSLWVPKEMIRDVGLLLRLASVKGLVQKEEVSICLAQEFKYHVVLPLHLKCGLLSHLGEPEDITRNIVFEQILFTDHMIPRDAKQLAAWEAFSKASCGVLNIFCGGGKTSLGLKKIAERQVPALVVVTNGGLVKQWIDRAGQFLDLAPSDIGIVQGDRAEWDKPLVIAMMQTLVQRRASIPLATRLRFGTVIWDELHHLSAQTFVTTADLFFGQRYGLTATVHRADNLEGIYLAHIGPVFHSDVESQINAEVLFKQTGFELPEGTKLGTRGQELVIAWLYQGLAELQERNELICADIFVAVQESRKILVLTHLVDHTAVLGALFETIYGTNRYRLGAVTGATPDSARTEIIRQSQVTFATFQIAKEGLDVPELDTLLLTTPFRDWGAFQQCKGRIERRCKKQLPQVIVYDDINIGVCAALCKTLRKGMNEHKLRFTTNIHNV